MANQSGAADLAEAAAAKRVPTKKKWVVGGKEYVQDELTFAEKGEFFGLLTRGIEEGLARGLQVNSLIEAFQGVDVGDSRDSRDVIEEVWSKVKAEDPERFLTEFGSILLRIFSTVPRLTTDALMLALSVPEEDRDGFRRDCIPLITDDQGFGIMALFREQNTRALLDFAVRWWAEVISPAVSSRLVSKSSGS